MLLENNIKLAPHTTIGLGGDARWYAGCSNTEELMDALKWARSKGLRTHILGGGSNSLISDDGYHGLVLHVKTCGLNVTPSGLMRVSAGENWDFVTEVATGLGLSGIECLAGIPGTVGATPIQNVGAYGQDVSETIVEVEAIDRATFELVRFQNADCQFSYRHSRFKGVDRDKFLITHVTFLLRHDPVAIKYPELTKHIQKAGLEAGLSNQDRLRRIRETVLRIRRSKGMVVDPNDPDSTSLGSFFTNPILSPIERDKFLACVSHIPQELRPTVYEAADGQSKLSAAWLIENSGTSRGERFGRVGVSTKHCLALVNCGGGTTSELLRLARIIQGRVEATFGIRLAIEPELIL